ncbi:Chitin-binding domain type 2 [Dermatophagoides farinae]|uniref:Chitin-binding domain type 2 n=1 Tax=Dermatophagoides farinae TaxID=6954 RepID=A0A922HSI7_DERFA|nr:Chitin-binding domain type 2 [Dermatophagoides farinae]
MKFNITIAFVSLAILIHSSYADIDHFDNDDQNSSTSKPDDDRTTMIDVQTTTVQPSSMPTTSESQSTVKPTTTTVKPSPTTVKPTTTTVKPTTTTVKPSPTTVKPTTTTVKPSPTTTTTTTTEQPEDEFECPTRFGYFADPKDPCKFYICSNWEAIHKSCPVKKTSEQKNFRFIEKMYNSFRQIIWTIIGFMVIIQLIEQQPSVQCGGGGGGGDQHSATTPHHNQPSHPRFLCPAQHGRFACRIDPQKYYLCDNFVPFLLDCPGTLFFDKTIKDCKSAGHFVLGTTAKPKH